MKKLSNTEAALKKRVAYKKACISESSLEIHAIFLIHSAAQWIVVYLEQTCKKT